MKILTLHRPLYDGCATPEEKAAAMTTAMGELQKVNANDGMDFAAKTAMGIAYERYVESSSQREEDRLFNDPLACKLYKPYGQTMSDALAFGLTYSIFDPPGANIGLGLEGHVLYTAARTKLINDHIETWLNNDSCTGNTAAAAKGSSKKQVLNLGAGLDTRAYWLDCLENASCYWEIDQASVHLYRESVLEGLAGTDDELPPTKCPRKPIAMDFNSKESILRDLPTKHGYDISIPTCWILEGLIMYLPRAETEQLLEDIAGSLSASGSYIILNFSTSDTLGPSIDEIEERLFKTSRDHNDTGGSCWTKVTRLMFGEEGFNFGRYPSDKPANTVLGFAMYQKGE